MWGESKALIFVLKGPMQFQIKHYLAGPAHVRRNRNREVLGGGEGLLISSVKNEFQQSCKYIDCHWRWKKRWLTPVRSKDYLMITGFVSWRQNVLLTSKKILCIAQVWFFFLCMEKILVNFFIKKISKSALLWRCSLTKPLDLPWTKRYLWF